MDFAELIRHRQSDRRNSDKPVEKEKLVKCLEAARLAPSAENAQPWKFIIIDDATIREKIADAASGLSVNRFTHQAPVLAAVVLEKANMLSTLGSVIQDKEYPLMDLGIATIQFCLQAADIGLGTCIIGWFNEKKVKKILNIEKKKRVPLLISIGYSESPQRKKIRKPLEKMSSWNSY
jgi:nitroreductase